MKFCFQSSVHELNLPSLPHIQFSVPSVTLPRFLCTNLHSLTYTLLDGFEEKKNMPVCFTELIFYYLSYYCIFYFSRQF